MKRRYISFDDQMEEDLHYLMDKEKEQESSKKWCLKEIEELQKEAQRYAKEKE